MSDGQAISGIDGFIDQILRDTQSRDESVPYVRATLYAFAAHLNHLTLTRDASLRARLLTLEQALQIAVNTCGDVTKFGRFSRSVDPVKWVEQLEAHLKAALAASRGREQLLGTGKWFVERDAEEYGRIRVSGPLTAEQAIETEREWNALGFQGVRKWEHFEPREPEDG